MRLDVGLDILSDERVKRRTATVLPVLLLVLALLLVLNTRQADTDQTAGEMDHLNGTIGELANSRPGKPSKGSRRSQSQKAEAKVPIAEPVQGQPGFVYHPVSGKIVDVRGIPAGLMVRQGRGKVFLIPKMGYIITSDAYRKAVENISFLGSLEISSGEGEEALMLLPGNDEGVSVVSCRPAHWETQWDDGTPHVPAGDVRGEPESSLE
ncbi:hypothetical protein OKA04_08055 [Luteolibacter flavescens]|uniref:Sortase n=1 Tax=Luteolibacter flavescens TaxID=1859460 RepID=A0ABT3FM73_9BACT|nr:hypothetical protein [Luteolibacter flavescens]MCW1884679.1 hypothetical protein [Luteolibacter flavescens]